MAKKIERFEDLLCWRKARQLANAVYDLTCHPKFSKDYKLRDQIQAAAGSVMHNVAEGFDAGSDLEFIRFLKIARRSASEVQSGLYLALDRSYIDNLNLRQAYELATEVKRLINGLIGYLRGSSPQAAKKEIHEPVSTYEANGLFDYETTRLGD